MNNISCDPIFWFQLQGRSTQLAPSTIHTYRIFDRIFDRFFDILFERYLVWLFENFMIVFSDNFSGQLFWQIFRFFWHILLKIFSTDLCIDFYYNKSKMAKRSCQCFAKNVTNSTTIEIVLHVWNQSNFHRCILYV